MAGNVRMLNFDTWLQVGLEQGFCGPAVCQTHDGTPVTAAEDDDFMAGQDPCVHILRLYPDTATAKAVERNHSPSVWRKPRAALKE